VETQAERLSAARYILSARAAWLRDQSGVFAVKGCRGCMQIRPKLTPKHPFAEKGRYIYIYIYAHALNFPRETRTSNTRRNTFVRINYSKQPRALWRNFNFNSLSSLAQSQVISAPAPFLFSERKSAGCAASISPFARTVVSLSLSLSHLISTLARQKTSSIPYQHHLFHPLQHLVSTSVFAVKMFAHKQSRLI
jgi:hypothetical protein